MMDASKKTTSLPLSRRKLIQLSTVGLAGIAVGAGCSSEKSRTSQDTQAINDRLKELGITLPEAPKALAAYAPYRIVGNTVYIAGQGPILGTSAPVLGKLGADLTLAQGQHAARLACINILAQARAACGGELGRIVQWVKMGGFVNCTDDFTEQPKVLNGATELLRDVFGEKGLPARFAVGANSLPFNICVEIDAVFQIRL